MDTSEINYNELKRIIMEHNSEIGMDIKTKILNLLGWIYGIAVVAVGIINTFWGNDTGFGIFLILLSFVFFPPSNVLLNSKTGLSIPVVLKIAVALFIFFAALGVGELFDKIDLMLKDLN